MDDEIEESKSSAKKLIIMLPKFQGNFREEILEPLMQQAAHTNTEMNTLGMLHMLLSSDEEWAACGGEGAKPAPKVKPATILPNASAAETRVYEHHQKPYAAERAFEVAARDAVKMALGQALFSPFQNRVTKLTNKTIAEIVLALREKYDPAGAEQDIESMQAALKTKPTDSTLWGVESWHARVVEALSILEDRGEPLPRGQQVEVAVVAFGEIPVLNELTGDFFNAYPLLKDQTLSRLMAYVTPRLGRVSSRTVGKMMGTTGTVNAVTAVAASAKIIALETRIRELEGGRAAAGGGGIPKREKFYCWKHGYLGHNSETCRDDITEEQRQARKPSDVRGGSTATFQARA